MSNITIRAETPQDYHAVELLARNAGLGYYGPDADEHLHVYKTRRHRAFVPELDFLAELDGKVAGSIMYTRSRIAAQGMHKEPRTRLPKWQVGRFSRDFPPLDLSWVKPIDYLLGQLEPPAREAIASLKHTRLYQLCRTSEALVASLPGIDGAALSTIRNVMRELNYGWGREHIERGNK